mmetsp:Transcript_1313/g.3363  ORF Transcript_1313/g.3363 Transcript_1313/m.3363 type:complete len:161 (-) Transcript_1313:39-521(-)
MIVVAEVVSVTTIPGKDKVREVVVRIDEAGAERTIVTNAPNVLEEKVGQRLVVALEGAEVRGLDEPVKKATVAGRPSEGMICDSRMLGWSGGGAGVAVFLDGIDVGSPPPAERPRPKAADVPAVTDGLFEKKPSKEEKKAAAKAAREARKAKKAEGSMSK